MNKYIVYLLLIVFCLPVTSYAQGQRAAAVFNNYKIYPTDLDVSDELAARKKKMHVGVKYDQFEYTYRMEILARRIHSLLIKRILNEQSYSVTDDEINAYLQHVRKIRSKLSEAEINHIRADIMNWHFDSIIFEKYGGRTVKLPTGRIKPVQAYYQLIEDMMSQKVLFFPDMNYRACLKVLEVYFERDKLPEAHELEAVKYFLQPTWGAYNARYNALPDTEKYRIKTRLKMLRKMNKKNQ